jgi:MYXO-CTERM domain-containing protein
VTLRSDPTASAVVSFGHEGGALFIDPYRGAVLGGLSPVHDFLHEVVEWHRWPGSREIGRPITGAATLGFLGLVVLGVYLWWRRRWTRETAGRAPCSSTGGFADGPATSTGTT